MNTLSAELKGVIARRLESASPSAVLAIASALCAPEIQIATPVRSAERFERISDVVRDRETGLMWTRATVGEKSLSWEKAKAAAAAVTIGSFTDWRLPTIKELLSLVDYERHEPAIDPVFECKSVWYWSATPYAPSPGYYAWFVHFDDGVACYGYQSGDGFVRAVRAGQ